ncbi:MAG TPA: hypothetical protein DEV87_05905 [Clostridiales bacterium]|nr:hypothetical protein [Clostridiales bacterium]
MKKKLTVLLLSLCALLCVFGAAACNDNPDTPPEPSVTESLTLNSARCELLVGDEFKLVATYTGNAQGEVSFVSDNAAVVEVANDGTITAVAEGEANVTASKGEKSAKCAVTVSFGSETPLLKFDESELSLTRKDSLDLNVKVHFNNKTFTPTDVEYSVEDEEIGKVENGKFVPEKLGFTKITATGKWGGKTLTSESMTVTVTRDLRLYFNDGGEDKVELYSKASYRGLSFVTEQDFIVRAFEDGEALTGRGASVIEGDDVISYENGKIKALKKGTAKIEIYCVDNGGERFTKTVDVLVKVPVAEITDPVELSLKKGVFSSEALNAMFESGSVAVTDISCDNDDVTASVSGGRVSIGGDFALATPVYFTVYTEEYGCKVPLVLYSDIITEASDFSSFVIARQDDYKNEGYYILGNDIDASGYLYKHTTASGGKPWISMGGGKNGFNGTFDGRGHVVNNMTIGTFGIFGYIMPKATIKNVAFTNVKYQDTYGNKEILVATLATCIDSSENVYPTLENLYIQASSFIGGENTICNLVTNSTVGYEKVKNCIFEFSGVDNIAGHGVYSSLVFSSNTKLKVENSYVISTSPVASGKGSNIIADSENKLAATKEKYQGLYPSKTDDKFIAYPLTRYNDYAEFKQNVSNLAAFDTAYWDISNGAPIFKGVQKVFKPYITVDGNPASELELILNEEKELGVTSFIGQIANVTFAVTSGSENVTIENGVLKGIKTGKAVVSAVFALGGENVTLTLNVNVVNEIITVNTPIEFSMMDGTLTSADKTAIFGSDAVEIIDVKATDITANLSLVNGKITGFPEYTAGAAPKTYEVLFTTADAIYKVNITPYTKIIKTVSDLSVFNFQGHTGYKNEGYYVLDNNINASGYLHKHTTASDNPTYIDWNTNGTTGFEGTIDGRGYTISNITIGTGGLLGYIRPKTTIKNLAITGITFQRTYGSDDPLTAALVKIMYSTKDSYPVLENLYIKANAFIGGADTNSNLVVNCTSGYEKIVNCIFEYSGAKDTTAGHGTYSSQIAGRNNTGFKVENSYVISLNTVACGGKTNPVYDSANKIEATTAEYTALYPDGSTYPKKDFYTVELTRYDDYAELTENVTDFSSFSDAYWDITAGYPVWKNA